MKRFSKIIALVLAICLLMSSTNALATTNISMCTTANNDTLVVLQEIIDEFNAAHEEINVEVTSPSDYENLLKTRMAANSMPDIFGTHGWATRRYNKYLLDLQNEPWVAQMKQGIRGIVTDSTGKLCTVPINQDMVGLCYNKNLIEKYGVDIDSLTTMDAFAEALASIHEQSNGEVIPMFLPGSISGLIGFLMNIFSAVGIGGNPNGGAENLLSLETADQFDWAQIGQIAELIHQFGENGYFNEDYLTAGFPDMIEAFANETCVFTFVGNDCVLPAKEINPSLEVGIMPIPAFTMLGETEPAFLTGEDISFGIWKDSEYVEECKEVLAWLSQPENVARICNMSGRPSAYEGVELSDNYWQFYFDKYADTKCVNNFDRSYLPNGIYDAMCDAVAKLLMNMVTVEEATDMLKTEYTRLMEMSATK